MVVIRCGSRTICKTFSMKEQKKKKKELDIKYGGRTFRSLKKGVVLTRVGRESVVYVGKDTVAHLLIQQSLKPVVSL
jgi:hypothetical protein